jgi:YebC/PmpR family DNA-binding regulatory protein
MSGHSKWSKVKHQKATTDVVRGREFTKASRAITIAVREGGGVADPNHNFRLRLAIEKAREVNMPKENIERAIQKGKGTSGVQIEQIMYEGYAPGGVALCIDTATDNRQRTVAEVKNIVERAGGSLGGPGAVAYLFDRCGILIVAKDVGSADTIFAVAVEAGAQDVQERDDVYEVYASVQKLAEVKEGVEKKGIAVQATLLVMRPKMSIQVDEGINQKIQALVAQLEDHDDVQAVFTNVGES